jgi:sortase B
MARHFKETTVEENTTPGSGSASAGNEVPPRAQQTVRAPRADAEGFNSVVTPLVPASPKRKTSGRRSAQGMPGLGSGRGGRRGRKRSNLLSDILLLVGVALLAVAVGMWGTQQWRYHEQDVVNRKLAAYAVVHDNELNSPVSEAPEVDWEGLKAINDDVVGWLQIPGTTINYPVYQAEDNERYLRHSATGEWTLGGQLFVDCENTPPGMVDSVTMVYGHHLLDGSMFEQIAALDKQERFDEIKTVWYVTEERAYELEPLMAYYVHEYDETARTFSFENDEKFREFLAARYAECVASNPNAPQIIAGTTHVLSLVTCNYYAEYENHGRTIVVCVPKEEAALAQGE